MVRYVRHVIPLAALVLGPAVACVSSDPVEDQDRIDRTMVSTPSAPSRTQACPGGLFTPVDVPIDVRPDPALIRQRAVKVDFGPLEGAAETLTLNPFENVCLTATRKPPAPGEAEQGIWKGVIEGVADSSVTLVTSGRTLIGRIISPPHTYQVRLLRDDVHLVKQVDPSRYPNEENPK